MAKEFRRLLNFDMKNPQVIPCSQFTHSLGHGLDRGWEESRDSGLLLGTPLQRKETPGHSAWNLTLEPRGK